MVLNHIARAFLDQPLKDRRPDRGPKRIRNLQREPNLSSAARTPITATPSSGRGRPKAYQAPHELERVSREGVALGAPVKALLDPPVVRLCRKHIKEIAPAESQAAGLAQHEHASRAMRSWRRGQGRARCQDRPARRALAFVKRLFRHARALGRRHLSGCVQAVHFHRRQPRLLHLSREPCGERAQQVSGGSWQSGRRLQGRSISAPNCSIGGAGRSSGR